VTSPTLDRDTPPSALGAPRRVAEFKPEDAAAVAEMFNGSNEGWPGGFTRGVDMTAEHILRMQRERAPLATFIAWDGDKAAGYCSLYEYPGEPGVAGYVGLLNAATAFHGRGHGRDLLKAALVRSIEQGYRRLDLHTWAGNMKAVPLYKKSGYFWVPDTRVHMENYLPLLLGTPALTDFWTEADWYTTMVREIQVQEDLFVRDGMKVYPYEFRHGDRYVKATIDATARGLTALETERWRISCTVDDRRLVVGRARTVRWQVQNRTGKPLAVTLLATAGKGLRLRKEETVTVGDHYETETTLTADPDYRPPLHGQSAPLVESLLLLDGLPVRLETGVEVKSAFELRLDPPRVTLAAGQPHEVTLRLVSHLAEDAQAELTLTPSPGLTLLSDGQQPGPLSVALGAQSFGGAVLRVQATAPGAHVLEARPRVKTESGVLEMAPVTLPLPATAPGEVVTLTAEAPPREHAEKDERAHEVRVETATLRLVVDLREGGFSLQDPATGQDLAGGRLLAGPPFSWANQSRVVHEATVERRDGAVAVVLRGPLPHLPHLHVEHDLRLTPDGLLRVQSAVANGGPEPVDSKMATSVSANREIPGRLVVPTAEGLLETSDPEFPDWGDLELSRPEAFAESWVAHHGGGRAVGVLWSDASRVELDRWSLVELVQDAGTLASGQGRTLPPVYIYCGPGDWQTVRARWRTLVQPGAPASTVAPRDLLALSGGPVPTALLAGQAVATLTSLANREVTGQLTLEVPHGWSVEPTVQEVRGVRIGRPQEARYFVRSVESGPRAAALSARMRGERAEVTVLEGALIVPGDPAGRVEIRQEDQAGQPVLTVDNGYLRYRVAPNFAGSLITLETVADGVNHVHSAYPDRGREFGWMRPWFGGIYGVVYSPGLGSFPDPARLYEETFTAQEVTESGQDGRRWQGVQVHSALRARGLRGLELRTTYLTLPGSNLLAVRVALRNTTSATLSVSAALVAYLQPGGAVEGAELLADVAGRSRLLRAQRTEDVHADGWVGVRDPRSGTTLALVSGDRAAEAQVLGADWGTLGAHAGALFTPRLGPSQERAALSYLAVARDEQEARAYRALSSTATLF